ncbi:uncharacterized protein LOC131066365 isoform X4 [Cryptomeria japonica]|uniref:uncharacterized protein LOC131066365 isoform X4 n=1 Tax=Cryptomeria japonica TaxID=3369 RepID=UPI0025AC04F9|nr:uncharacterized protein LOC131066365 isoform X4 [Cryptomeria japonica]
MAVEQQHLKALPSRGCFSAPFTPSNPDGLRPYVCDHDTAPPEDQVIKTDSTNILIRSLTLKKGKTEPKPKDNKRKPVAENVKGKRQVRSHLSLQKNHLMINHLQRDPIQREVRAGCQKRTFKVLRWKNFGLF